MKKNLQITLGIIILIILGVVIYLTKVSTPAVPTQQATNTTPESIIGCYVAHLSKDVYSLSITSQQGELVQGTLSFNNFEKDSSHGTFAGSYKDGILLGDYSFSSEGMDSVMQVIFKKQGTGFVRGYGPVDSQGTHFTDMSAITYDQSALFASSSDGCTPVVTTTPTVNTEDSVVMGDTNTINTVEITFNKVTQDNRCPTDAVCIIAGTATANLKLTHGTKSVTKDIVAEGAPYTFDGYSISVTHISPDKKAGKAIDPKTYVIRVSVTKI